MIQKFDAWHKTRQGYLIMALLEAVLALVFMGLAIGRGNILWYLVTLALLIGFLQNFFKFANSFGRRRRG